MTQWEHRPFIYEINTAVWLTSLSTYYKRTITLDTVPDEVLDYLAGLHLDAIWLMGVWRRSPAVRESALNYIHEYEPVLPDITEDDVMGSAYAIGGYEVDERLGGREGLSILRWRLGERGLRLILDFVPNHVATDHPWVYEQRENLVTGSEALHKEKPGMFFPVTNMHDETYYVAHGRDPYFPSWIDTAQLNAFSESSRQAAQNTLMDIASQCDGVRCDMAMLMVNSVFQRTWGDYLPDTPVPKTEYWQRIIPAIKEAHPDFVFIAEVYWDMEYLLLEHGFDYTYDKRLYDRIIEGNPARIRDHLMGPLSYQDRQVRFIENHDEPRAAATMGYSRSRAGAVLVSTLPGATLLHDGQFNGRRKKLPVQIKRQPDEPPNHALDRFYKQLLEETRSPIYQHGMWRLFKTLWPYGGIETHHNLIAYGWNHGDSLRLVVVNITRTWSQGVIDMSYWNELIGDRWVLYDVLGDTYHFHDGDELVKNGLYVELEAYQSRIFRFSVTGRTRSHI